MAKFTRPQLIASSTASTQSVAHLVARAKAIELARREGTEPHIVARLSGLVNSVVGRRRLQLSQLWLNGKRNLDRMLRP